MNEQTFIQKINNLKTICKLKNNDKFIEIFNNQSAYIKGETFKFIKFDTIIIINKNNFFHIQKDNKNNDNIKYFLLNIENEIDYYNSKSFIPCFFNKLDKYINTLLNKQNIFELGENFYLNVSYDIIYKVIYDMFNVFNDLIQK